MTKSNHAPAPGNRWYVLLDGQRVGARGHLDVLIQPDPLRVANTLNACEGLDLPDDVPVGALRDVVEALRAVAEARRRWRSQDEAETIDSIEYMDMLDAADLDSALAALDGGEMSHAATCARRLHPATECNCGAFEHNAALGGVE